MDEFIDFILREDIGNGDITTDSIVAANHISLASIIAKDDGVIAGHVFASEIFKSLDQTLYYKEIISDGEIVKKGDSIAELHGKTRAILTGERVALNILQRLSGIATLTRKYVIAAEEGATQILDTRKTAPGLRKMEKYAVRMGGGFNHRFDLSEMALVKENHIEAAGSIKEALRRLREKSDVFVEVEVKNMDELHEAMNEKVDRIMLDNWDIDNIKNAVNFVDRRIPIEVSGNMTVEKVRQVTKTGIDYISVGAITHSFKALDMTLLVKESKGDI